MQVDFNYKATVTEILTQGRRDASQWVTSYTLGYSDDGTNFKTYKGNNGQDKVTNRNFFSVYYFVYLSLDTSSPEVYASSFILRSLTNRYYCKVYF